MHDVLIVGAGPAGAVAATVLARAGARVRLVDRADVSARQAVRRHGQSRARWRACGGSASRRGIDARGLRVDGMLVTGERGVAIDGRYPDGVSRPRDHPARSRLAAAAAGDRRRRAVRAGRRGRGARSSTSRARRASVGGVVVGANGRESPVARARRRSPPTAGARRSRSASASRAIRARPRRWAIGAYFENSARSDRRPVGPSDLVRTLGEMHIRRGRYIGVAPIPGGLDQRLPRQAVGRRRRRRLRDPAALLARELAARPAAARSARRRAARAARRSCSDRSPSTSRDASIDGLLLAGDAAGFIDPMTGDGLRFAVRGGELAAAAALDALAHGWTRRPRAARPPRGGASSRRSGDSTARCARWSHRRARSARPRSAARVRAGASSARVIARAGDCDVACAAA